MSSFKLFLFGPPRLERAGARQNLERRRAEALLAYLAVTRQRHSREALATLFWPEVDSVRGRANLSRTLSVVNATLGADCLAADRSTVELSPQADLWVDVTRFGELLATCRTHGHPESMVCAACLPPLAEAAALYKSDFLHGFTLPGSVEWDTWQLYETEGLRRELASALERLGRGHRAQGNWDSAILFVRRWVGVEPLHEPAHRQLMALYARSGQQAAALAQFETCRQILEAELGLEPAEETMALAERIGTGALEASVPLPARASHVLAKPPAFLREESGHIARPPPIFVARRQELARLGSNLRAAQEAEGRVLFITGAAGCGKTALMSEFARRAEKSSADLIVVSGTCHAYAGSGDPYLPFRDVMGMLSGDVEARWAAGLISREHACRIWETLPGAVEAVLDHGPDLIDVLVPGRELLLRAELAAPAGASWLEELNELATRKRASPTDIGQSYLIGQFVSVLRTLAADRPMLITLDDLQWADSASAGVLFQLGRNLAGSRILLVCAYRPEEISLGRDGERHPLEKVLGEFRRTFGDIWIDLDETEAEEDWEFVDALLDSEPNRLGASFREALFQRTRGHPLFTVELLRGMQERGNLVRDEDGRWIEGSSLDWRTLPARAEGVIEERINRLEPEPREILSVASVEGERFTPGAIARVQGVGELHIQRHLSQLEKRHRLVHEREEVRLDYRRLSGYQFTHNLFQAYLYSELSAGERRLLHGRLARALEEVYEGHTEEITVQLAHHFLEAGERLKAATYLERAGAQARRTAALEEAARHFRSALAHWDRDDAAGRAELMRNLGECLWMYGDPQQALEVLEAAYELFAALNDRTGAGVTQRIMAEICLEEAVPERCLHHHQQALALLEAGPETVELARAISALSRMHSLASEHEEALAWGEEALEMAGRLGAEDVKVHALNSVGSAYAALGDPERGLGLLRDSLDQALALNLPFDVARAYYNLADELHGLGRLADALDTLESYRAYGVRVQSMVTVNYAVIFLALVEWLSGQWASALARRPQITEWIDGTQSTGYHKILGRTTLGLMDNDLGQVDAAGQTLACNLSLARESGMLQRAVPYLGQLARAYSALGMEKEALNCVQEILGWFHRTPHIRHLSPSATICLLLSCQWLAARASPERLDAARACLRFLRPPDEQAKNPVKAAIFNEAQGSLALAEGRNDQAIEGFRLAVDGWQTVGRPYDQLRALKGLGLAWVENGEGECAQATFDQALGIVTTLADELQGPGLQTTFMSSPLVQGVRKARATLSGVSREVAMRPAPVV